MGGRVVDRRGAARLRRTNSGRVPTLFSRPKHLANVVVGQLNTVIAMAGSLIVTPAVLHGLGDSSYGGWLLINSFIGYMRFLDLGATTGTVKFAAGAYERDDKEDLAAALNTSAAIFMTRWVVLSAAYTVPAESTASASGYQRLASPKLPPDATKLTAPAGAILRMTGPPCALRLESAT